MEYKATVEQYRADYMGVLARPFARKSFHSLADAIAWADTTLRHSYIAGYSVVEGPAGFITTSSSDGGDWE